MKGLSCQWCTSSWFESVSETTDPSSVSDSFTGCKSLHPVVVQFQETCPTRAAPELGCTENVGLIMRTDFDPREMSSRDFYRLLTAVVVPRPIAWVSSTSETGVDNLAPHSFYTVASVNPPIVQFTSVGEKDSLRNIEAQKEFVVNLTPAWLFEEVNATGTDFPAEISEFDAVGLTREPSTTMACAPCDRSTSPYRSRYAASSANPTAAVPGTPAVRRSARFPPATSTATQWPATEASSKQNRG